MKINYTLLIAASIILFQFLISSCANVRQTEYFADQNDAIIKSINIAPSSTIQPNDILSIAVSSLNPS
ncbi:MAG: polysaccharide biosynthesis/export protein, partial [Mucilaginibacter sp.]|nr:polysaccharide biosynthesis/export protein [Mucilaginibacter sp.]